MVEEVVVVLFWSPPPSLEDGELLKDRGAEKARRETVEDVERSRRRLRTAFDYVVTA